MMENDESPSATRRGRVDEDGTPVVTGLRFLPLEWRTLVGSSVQCESAGEKFGPARSPVPKSRQSCRDPAQVLSGEMRFLRMRAYPENFAGSRTQILVNFSPLQESTVDVIFLYICIIVSVIILWYIR